MIEVCEKYLRDIERLKDDIDSAVEARLDRIIDISQNSKQPLWKKGYNKGLYQDFSCEKEGICIQYEVSYCGSYDTETFIIPWFVWDDPENQVIPWIDEQVEAKKQKQIEEKRRQKQQARDEEYALYQELKAKYDS